MDRRHFLRVLGFGTVGLLVPTPLEPRRKIWQVSQAAPFSRAGNVHDGLFVGYHRLLQVSDGVLKLPLGTEVRLDEQSPPNVIVVVPPGDAALQRATSLCARFSKGQFKVNAMKIQVKVNDPDFLEPDEALGMTEAQYARWVERG